MPRARFVSFTPRTLASSGTNAHSNISCRSKMKFRCRIFLYAETPMGPWESVFALRLTMLSRCTLRRESFHTAVSGTNIYILLKRFASSREGTPPPGQKESRRDAVVFNEGPAAKKSKQELAPPPAGKKNHKRRQRSNKDKKNKRR